MKSLRNTLKNVGTLTKSIGQRAAGGIADKAIRSGKKLVDQVDDSRSPVRVLIDRALPNFDANSMRKDVGWFPAGENAGSRLLAVNALSALKGTGTAYRNAAADSLKNQSGLLTGRIIGSGLGAAGGGVTGWNSSDDDSDQKRNALVGLLAGGVGGAFGGGRVGMKGTSVYKGLRTGAANFSRRAKGWDNLISMGVLPPMAEDPESALKLLTDARSKITNTRGVFGKLKALKTEGGSALRTLIDQSDRGVVGQLTSAGRDPRAFMLSDLPDAIRATGLKSLKGGDIVNQKLGDMLNSPGWQERIRRTGLEKFYGNLKGNSVLETKGAFSSKARQDRILSGLDSAFAKADGFRPSSFTPRQRTSSLRDDLRNASKQSPIYDDGIKGDRTAGAKFIKGLSPLAKRRTGLKDSELSELLYARRLPGNESATRVWEGVEQVKQPFSMDLKDMSKSVLPDVNVRNLDLKGNTIRRRLMNADKRLTADGVSENWNMFGAPARRELGAIRDRAIRGEAVDIPQEIGNLAGATKAELIELFAKSPPPAPIAELIKAVEASKPAVKSPDVKTLTKLVENQKASPKLVPVVSSGENAFKKGDIWDLMKESISDAKARGQDVKKFLPSWDKIEDALGMTPEDLMNDAGVYTPKQWEQFKKLIMREISSGGEMRKAALYGPSVSFKLRWAMRKLRRAY